MGSKRPTTISKTVILSGLALALAGCPGASPTPSKTGVADDGAAIFGLTAKTKGLAFHVDKLPAKLVALDDDTGLVLQVAPPRRASYFITFKKGDTTAANAVLSEIGDYTIDVVGLDVQSCRLKLVYGP